MNGKVIRLTLSRMSLRTQSLGASGKSMDISQARQEPSGRNEIIAQKEFRVEFDATVLILKYKMHS